MTNPSKSQPARPTQPQVVALFMMGGGLLLLGLLAIMLMPRSNPLAEGEAANRALAVPAIVRFDAPDLALTDLQNRPVSLAAWRGKAVLINNWATWCPPCKEEMPTLQKYYELHRGQNFDLIAIEAGEPVSEVAGFVSEHGLTFPVWPDPQQKALEAFRNDALPNSYLVDRSGVVRLAWIGAISLENLEKYVTPLLEK